MAINDTDIKKEIQHQYVKGNLERRQNPFSPFEGVQLSDTPNQPVNTLGQGYVHPDAVSFQEVMRMNSNKGTYADTAYYGGKNRNQEPQQTAFEVAASRVLSEVKESMKKISYRFHPIENHGHTVDPCGVRDGSDYIVSYHIENHIVGKELYVQDSNNVTTVIQPRFTNEVMRAYRSGIGSKPVNGVMINTCYIFKNLDVARETRGFLVSSASHGIGINKNDREVIISEIDNLIAYAARNGTNYDPRTAVSVKTVRVIPVEMIQEHGRLYVISHNLVLSLSEEIVSTPHPLSVGAERSMVSGEGISLENLPEFKGRHGFFIDLIDNDDIISSKWLSSNGLVVQIKPTKDPLRANGAYVTIYHNGAKVEDKYFTLDDISKAGLFSSHEEAVAFGDKELIKEQYKNQTVVLGEKQSQNNIIYRNQAAAYERERAQHRFDDAIQKKDNIIENKEREIKELRERHAQELKEKVQEAKRAALHDTIRNIAAFIGAIGSVAALFLKLQKEMSTDKHSFI